MKPTTTQKRALSMLSGTHWHDMKQFPYQIRVWVALREQGLVDCTLFKNVILDYDEEAKTGKFTIRESVWLVRLKKVAE